MTQTTESPAAAPTPAAPATAVPDKGLFARAVGIVFSPRQTFEVVVAHPRSFLMLVILLVVTAVAVGGFMATTAGQQAFLDAMEKRPGSTAQGMEMMQKIVPYMWIFYAVGTLIMTPLFLLVFAGILLAVFTMMGGNASFKQVFAVVVYAGVINVLGAVVKLPVNFATGSMTTGTNLGVLLPMLDDRSFLALFLGTIDLFMVWMVVVLSIGLAVVYKRKTGPIATTFFIIYALIAAGYAAIAAARS